MAKKISIADASPETGAPDEVMPASAAPRPAKTKPVSKKTVPNKTARSAKSQSATKKTPAKPGAAKSRASSRPMPPREITEAALAAIDKALGETTTPAVAEKPTPAATDQAPAFLFNFRHLKWAVVAAVVTLVIGIGGWTACAIYRSKIAVGTAVLSARLDDTTLTQALEKQVTAYRLTLQDPDGSKHTYPLEKLGLKLDPAVSVQATRRQQQSLIRRLQWWQPVPATLTFKQDTAALDRFIDVSARVTVQPSQDAVLTITDGTIKIKDAVTGKQYGLSQPRPTLLAAARELRPAAIKLHALSVTPALTAASLEAYKPLLEKTLNQSISLTVGDAVITPKPADIANWLEITPNDKTKKVDITVNSGKVLEYINKTASADIRPAKTQVETTREDGTSQVLVAGVNGVDIPNKSDTAATIAKNLLTGKGLDVTLPLNYDQFKTINTGLYDKWIEVDLTSKQLYAYEKANLVKTEPVSAGAPATPTVTGQYAVYAKFPEQDMRGRNVDGSNYFQPHVRFISYFYKDYAIHGNYWRPLSYFGNINSSHGCVSMPDVEAEWIYNWATVGTPVIVHT